MSFGAERSPALTVHPMSRLSRHPSPRRPQFAPPHWGRHFVFLFRLPVWQFHLVSGVRMSFAFELGQATLDGPDDVDKLLQHVRGFRRQLCLVPDRLD